MPRIKAARLAAARARRKTPEQKRTAWEAAELYWIRFTTIFKNFVAISVVGFIIFILYRSVTQNVISIAPISVPKELADRGYTAEVAAERLQSALYDIVKRPQTSSTEVPNIAMQADLPSIVVPSTAFSTETVAAQLRSLLKIESRTNLSGEITILDKDLWLRLRMNGRDLYASVSGADLDHPDDLYNQAAQKILRLTLN